MSKHLSETKVVIKKSKPKPKLPKDDDDDIFTPVPPKTAPPKDDNENDEDLIDLEEIEPGSLVDTILDVVQVAEDKKKWENENAYGLTQLKRAVTSLDNIL